MKRRFKIVFIFCVILCLISGCRTSKEDAQTLHFVDEKENCMDIVKQSVSHKILMNAVDEKLSLKDMSKKIPLEFIREIDNNYRSIVKTEQGWVLLFFDSDGTFLRIQELGALNSTSKDDFLEVTVGMSVYDIQEIDPKGNYNFMYASWSEYPRMSFHYTSDGYEIIVSYNSRYNVINIYTGLI